MPKRNNGDAFAREIDVAGDWNGDGWPDLMLSGPGFDGAAGQDCGLIQIRSGKDGSVLHALEGSEARINFGRFFASAPGDVNGDQTIDFYVVDFEAHAETPNCGEVRVISGADGSQIHRFQGKAGEGLGIGNAVAGDVNSDGKADLVVGAWVNSEAAPSAGKVYLYSGATGKVLRTWTCKIAGETFGFDATGMGDLNDDGRTDFLITGAWSNANGAKSGRVCVISG